jgi:proteasome lid subunit RPN8/RPN11
VIRIPETLVRAIRDHARREYPHECCGALLGRVEPSAAGDGEIRVVVALRAAENRREAEAAPRRFLITSEDYRAIEREARERALDVLGFYHSHPDHPARPSEYDRDHALPWYSYVIVSVREGRAGETPADLTSWVLGDDRHAFAFEPIATEPPGRKPGGTRGKQLR